MKDTYGFEVSDCSGSFKRWFSSNTTSYEPMTPDLKDMCIVQVNYEFKKAFEYCREESAKNAFEFKVLTEEDFKATGNPVKEFFGKIFGRKKK